MADDDDACDDDDNNDMAMMTAERNLDYEGNDDHKIAMVIYDEHYDNDDNSTVKI
ncbi:hypothetical protein LOAG_09926, partial [Loa loa]